VKRFLVALMLVAVPAAAEFTPAEKVEIAKVINHQTNMGSTFNQLGDGIRDYGTETLRDDFYLTFQTAVDSLWQCHEALRGLFGVDGGTPASGTSAVSQCETNSLIFANQLDELAAAVLSENAGASSWASSINALANTVRNNQLGTFNGALAYADPRPADYPAIVGPHGDFDSAQEHLAEMNADFIRAVAVGAAFYGQVQVWPVGANVDFREFIRYAVTPIKNTARIWGMEHNVVLPSDAAKINGDLAFATSIGVQRGFTFFRALREAEIFNGTPHQPPLFSGRTMQGGSVQNFAIGFAEFPKAWGEVFEVNTHDEILRAFTGVKNLNATASVLVRATSRWIPSWSEVLSAAWEAGDEWHNSLFMFFHPVVNVCGPGTHAEGGICVPDGGGSGGLTCGAGTVEVNGECVADCPTCGTCPSFIAEAVLLDPTTVQCQVVELP